MTPVVGTSLSGRRVVITRAADQAIELVARLRELGAVPLVVPLIEITEPADGGRGLALAIDRLVDYEWLIVTSPNGARRIAERLVHQFADFGTDRPLVAAVGTATAAALAPIVADLVPIRQLAEGLIDDFPAATAGNGPRRVLIAQVESACATLAEGLMAKGWQVDTVVAYRTLAVRPSPADVLAARASDAVLFASGSAVRSWVEVFGPGTPPIVVAIGPATATVAEKMGLKVDAVATDHSVGGLVTCLLNQVGGARLGDPG